MTEFLNGNFDLRFESIQIVVRLCNISVLILNSKTVLYTANLIAFKKLKSMADALLLGFFMRFQQVPKEEYLDPTGCCFYVDPAHSAIVHLAGGCSSNYLQ